MTAEHPSSRYTLGEEIANSVSHGAGLLTAIAGAPVLIVAAARVGATSVVSATIFATTMIQSMTLSGWCWSRSRSSKTKLH